MAVLGQAQVTLTDLTDISALTIYYYQQTSTLAAPAKPTVKTPTGWVTTEPSVDTTKSLYSSTRTDWSNGEFTWSDVSLSSSYEAAKAAYNKAVAAQATANNLSRLIRETEDGVDVGKSADGTTYANGTSVTRQGTDGTFSILKVVSGVLTSVASFGENLIELGKNSTSAVIKFCGGKASIGYNEDPQVQGYFTGSLTPASGARPSLWPMVSVKDDVVTMRGSTIKVGALNSDRTNYNSTTAPMANLASLVNLRVFTGSTIVTINSGGNAVLMSANAYQTQVGREYAQAKDMVFVMNGDSNVGDTTITAGYWPSDGNIWIHCGQITSRQVRVNWMFVFAGV